MLLMQKKYGWSIVQQTIHHFEIVDSATWRFPNGIDPAISNMSVTQVSYNDAIAYCEWSGTTLPSYEEYWKLTAKDDRNINITSSQILAPENVNIIGNTWDITTSSNPGNEIRLAGGSYLCSKNSCDGSNPDRILFVSKDTGNTHISFSVTKNH